MRQNIHVARRADKTLDRHSHGSDEDVLDPLSLEGCRNSLGQFEVHHGVKRARPYGTSRESSGRRLVVTYDKEKVDEMALALMHL